ncbi:WD40 repeat-like protein [Pterulicium gracile]|uniref:Elongator complex protein 2 n=1 Tax=Pterulicium gracile TaxID=1884261 RepID=A0A5C3QY17_9AGAR|nr:WD40 repeat-like protein [Pterula gracilis]
MATTCYVSAAANRQYCASDVSPTSLVSFGCSNSVALWDATDKHERGVLQTLPGHSGLVTCTRFFSDNVLLSADDTGLLLCRKRTGETWKETFRTQAHKSSISIMCIHASTVITGSSDAELKVWEVEGDNDRLSERQTIPLQGKYPLSLAVTQLPASTSIILAVGCTSQEIQIWIRSDSLFVEAASLPGHEDWVRCLAFTTTGIEALSLASGSQDSTIRLWNVEPFSKTATLVTAAADQAPDDLLDAFEASLGDLADIEEGGRQISLKRHVVTVKSPEHGTQKFSITFDALLVGHEAAVNSLAWRPSTSTSDSATPTLLSSSTDSSAILWSPSSIMVSQTETSSIWINSQRFGDVGGQRLGGFVEALWAREGTEVLAHGWSGGWRRWRNSEGDDWEEVGAITGHNGSVKDVDWAPKGEYLISVGLDQTTRIHGPVALQPVECWHELARPQVHGYDLVGVGFLSALNYVSVADEKVARVFEAPKSFVHNIQHFGIAEVLEQEVESRPESATVPPLGLSNKASQNAVSAVSSEGKLLRRPFEGELSAVTLWPEIDKIFGHGYESVTVGVSNNKKYFATACKSTNTEHAVVRVYRTDNWQPFGATLPGHALTITRIVFSPDDSLILSVSRDRTWRLFEHSDTGYTPVASDKSHGRIIWDCCWTVEGDAFATASRDKTVRIWAKNDGRWTTVVSLKCKESATAVSLSSTKHSRRQLAIGLEDGEIQLYESAPGALSQWNLRKTISAGVVHTKTVSRLAWRPNRSSDEDYLASCSEDGMIRILYIPNTC